MKTRIELINAPIGIQPGGYVPRAYADRTEPTTPAADVEVTREGAAWRIALSWECPNPIRDISDDTNLFVVQYFGFFQMGGGNYLRTAPIMTFNWVNGDYNIPIGLGFGKVFKLKGGNVLNVFIEPQFSIAHDGAGQPEAQLFFGVNTQFM